MNEQPIPWDQLYKNLFERRDSNQTFSLLSEGITAFLRKAEDLITDAMILKDAERYEIASFLGYTASEEMAKIHIFIDACRVDLPRHNNVLKKLCKSFYSHIAKYAYKEVLSFPALYDMEQVKEAWDYQMIRWWPSNDIESGEPDMPHTTYFRRELPLYVDYIEYDQQWYNPRIENRPLIISTLVLEISNAKEKLELLRNTYDIGLYKLESLSIINDVYKRHYINERTPTGEVDRIYMKAAQQIENELGIPQEKFTQSTISKWPLYHFVTVSRF